MNRRMSLGILALLLPTFGCGGMSADDNRVFRSEVAQNVAVNMSLSKATERLSSIGFLCDERTSAPQITCTRERNDLLESCVQRVNLSADAARQSVTAVTPKPIACLGGF